jgi:hypothetical protein
MSVPPEFDPRLDRSPACAGAQAGAVVVRDIPAAGRNIYVQSLE